MNVTIVGGGPAGLYCAILLKRQDPSHNVKVIERNPREVTWGWGVVFSDQTLSYLAEPDPLSFGRLETRLAVWDNVDVVHHGERVTIRGNRFAGVARIALLEVLQRRAAELGVQLAFGVNIQDTATLEAHLAAEDPPADLVVGADGIQSVVRELYRESFGPQLDLANNHFIWLGTPHLFHGLTLTFRSTEAGLFIAHSYKYGPNLSTFIVECDPATFAAAGLTKLDDQPTRNYLAEVFAADLQGEPLLSNNSRWIRFTTVSNARWWHHDRARRRHIVLLGDALHTAHFSIGSGTKMALEDAIALDRAFAEQGTGPHRLSDALATFEAIRRPRVEQLQAAAATSKAWFENAAADLELSPLAFAYRVMTRSARIDHESLRRRDPEFAAACGAAGLLSD